MNWQERSLQKSEEMKDASPEFASFTRRFLAFLVDTLIVYLLLWPGYSILARSEASTARNVFDFLFSVFGISFNLWNNVYLVSKEGASIGRKMLGIVILDGNFRNLTMFAAFARMMSRVLSLIPFCLGFFWMLWDPKYQTWHDKIVDSYVYVVESLRPSDGGEEDS